MTIRNRSLWLVAALMGRVAALAILATAAVAAPGESFSVEWGEESDGIRCRLVALRTATNDDAPDLSVANTAYATGDDLTFGVELKNVGDAPVTLLGVHLGEGWVNGSGALAAEELGPSLFEFEFAEATGSPMLRAPRESLDVIYLEGALGEKIGPGKTLTVVLRPARFSPPLAYHLPPGEYRARLRYRGASSAVRQQIERVRPGRPEVGAWSGEVASNQVAFTVAGGQRATPPAELRWGEAKDGLRAAVDFRRRGAEAAPRGPAETVPLNSVLDVTLHFENVSTRPISFVTETWSQSDHLFVTDSAGRERRMGGASATTGMPEMVRWTLPPGEIADVPAAVIGVGDDKSFASTLDDHPMSMNLAAMPGTYMLRYVTRMGDGAVGRPGSDWHGELVTGEAPLVVR